MPEERVRRWQLQKVDWSEFSELCRNTIVKTQSPVSQTYVKFVPQFKEDDVEKFFTHFEKLAERLHWPKDKWALLIQSKFVGKAQEVYSALLTADSMNCAVIKGAVLRAYELVPEAYRQKFRNYTKTDDQIHVEFAHVKEKLFDQWCSSQKLSEFDQLRQLI
ncbi:hypothetical protein HOLleu_02600 [Holothuria leucospilota]|uniref:SCAN box domain-containing protein n=1 Tax=Holothuria leucospilota TaxID=206669 RepID=A0A9Q1HKZ2_HOLLE|nr:hypothetical protein HOLleu_02600 [Holothuria leucospilota]